MTINHYQHPGPENVRVTASKNWEQSAYEDVLNTHQQLYLTDQVVKDT